MVTGDKEAENENNKSTIEGFDIILTHPDAGGFMFSTLVQITTFFQTE